MGLGYVDAPRSTANVELTERNYVVAAVDDALRFEANLLPGVENAPERLVETGDPLAGPRFNRVGRIHPFHPLCPEMRTELTVSVLLLGDAVEPLHVLLRHRPPSIPRGGSRCQSWRAEDRPLGQQEENEARNDPQ
jgi:hypothetical protein